MAPSSSSSAATTVFNKGTSIVSSTMHNRAGPRPKMIRAPKHQLPNLHCIAAYSTREAILTKDADHKEVEDPPVTREEVANILSDAVITLEHSFLLMIDTCFKTALISLLPKTDDQIHAFFLAGNQELKEVTDQIFSRIFSFIAKTEPFTTATGGGHLHLEASHRITENITSSLSSVIIKHKEVFLRSVLSPVKCNDQTKPLVELIIHGSNYDNIWKEALYTLSIGKSVVSPNTLALKIATIEQNVTEQRHNHTEVDHQIAKIATRLGDLKTSEMEQRCRVIENDIKIHNLKHIDEGTQKPFRSLNYTEKSSKIHKLVTDHLKTKNASFTTKIISPRTGSKSFEEFAYVKFSSSDVKFEFEKNFAHFKRNNPGYRLYTRRPSPQFTPSDRDLPDISDIKTRIGLMYNQAVMKAKYKNPHIAFNELSSSEIDAIQVTQKELHKPFKLYYEFLCPTNNTTFMPYAMNMNPFSGYDFSQTVPNPVTRHHARSD